MADPQEFCRITTSAQLDDFFDASSSCSVWLFKHSLICATSASAWRAFQKFAARQSDHSVTGLIEIQRARDISKEIEARTGVRHESPQVFLVRDGLPIWHASHWGITEEALDEAAKAFAALETVSPA